MKGSIYLTFKAQSVGLNPSDYPHMDNSNMSIADNLKEFSRIARTSPVIGDLNFANNLNGTEYVKREQKDRLQAHHVLSIDPRTNRFTIENRYGKVALEVVVVHCWITVAHDSTLKPSTWGSWDRKRGVQVTRDPSKDDKYRMFIRIITENLRSARLLLHQTLRGELCSTSWVI